jgi:hypothetical protein
MKMIYELMLLAAMAVNLGLFALAVWLIWRFATVEAGVWEEFFG